MKIYVASSKRITKYTLPIHLEEFFSVEYQPDNSREKYTITFTGDDATGKWYLKSNGSVDIVSKDSFVDQMALEYYHCYFVKLFGIKGYTLIYAMPNQEDELYSLNYSGLDKITIGSDQTCNICFNYPLVQNVQATIEKENNEYVIKSGENLKLQVFLNDKQVTYAKLKYGDVIFINGLKIIWLPSCIKINNPNKQVLVSGLQAYTVTVAADNVNTAPVSDEEASKDLYTEDDYFYHIPKIQEEIETKEIEIDSPPASKIQEELPFILTAGSSITMLVSAFITGMNVYNRLKEGNSVNEELVNIISFVALLISSVLLPMILRFYNKRLLKRGEKKRLNKYREYLKKKEEEIEQEIKHQETILNDNNDSTIKCVETIEKGLKNAIWNREIRDDDFLNISLGTGEINAKLNIMAPTQHFELETDELYQNVYDMVDNHKLLHNVPITFSFATNPISSFIFNCTYKNDYINSLILKIATFHSGADLKIIILTDKRKETYWDFAKILPHCWSEDKSIRFFASSINEANDISAFLDEEFKLRKESKKVSEGEDDSKENLYKANNPYYLIITDNYLSYKNLQIIMDIVTTKANYGFSLITFAESMKFLPNRCENFVQVGESGSCILTKKVSDSSQIKFTNEYVPNIDMESLCTKLANIPLMPKDGLKELPQSISFLEMFNVSKIEQLNILNRWQSNNPVKSLAATVGVHSDLEPFKLDLHEKFHGPHGLIAGSTGSGKSEFIITYILSMALNYHPYEVQFVLIDYKGGGLAGAFENKETGVKLPHLVGTITNLDTSEMNRTLVSIDSELKRRQKVFNETKDVLGESTIDIYKYQRLYREGRVKEPMAHLFIISDEFAELKQQQPEFMDQLITTARIGRSLGLHLILATQKPSGVVNDQIWSNSKFKVCLKVQDRSDSMEMLKRPEAASIKNAGRFYLQIGYDDYFDIGQSGWGGAKYVPSNKIIRKVDDSIDFVNNTGYVVKAINDEVKKDDTNNLGDQLTNIVKYIYNLGIKEKISTKKLWLDKLSNNIYVDKLKEKYSYKPQSYVITPVYGEYDSPETQTQGLLTLDLTNKGNTIIYGKSGSGKENLLCTLFWSMMIEHTPDEVNIYAIDCGAEVLKMFYKMPHVGDIVTINEEEKIVGIFNMVEDEMNRRKELFADYAGSYTNYCANSGNKLPLIVVTINNYDNFRENYSKLSDAIQSLYRECAKYGIVFIITAISTNVLSSRITQFFGNVMTTRFQDELEYRNILNSKRGLTPAKVFGRGLTKVNDDYKEYQTAYFCNTAQMSQIVKMAAEKLCTAYKTRAPKIMVVPDVIGVNKVISELDGLIKIPVGYDIDKKEIKTYNFTNDRINIVLSNEMSENMEFIYGIARMITTLKDTRLMIVDFVNALDRDFPNTKIYKDNFDSVIAAIANELKKDKESTTRNVYIMVAPGAMKFKLSEQAKKIMSDMFSNVNSLQNNYFIFADDYDNIKNLKVDEWYQTQVNNSNGIWLGEGIGSQMAINVSNVTLEDRKKVFPYMGYVISNGKKKTIKYVIDEDLITNEGAEVLDEK